MGECVHVCACVCGVVVCVCVYDKTRTSLRRSWSLCTYVRVRACVCVYLIRHAHIIQDVKQMAMVLGGHLNGRVCINMSFFGCTAKISIEYEKRIMSSKAVARIKLNIQSVYLPAL